MKFRETLQRFIDGPSIISIWKLFKLPFSFLRATAVFQVGCTLSWYTWWFLHTVVVAYRMSYRNISKKIILSRKKKLTLDNGIRCRPRSGALCSWNALAKVHNGARICRSDNHGPTVESKYFNRSWQNGGSKGVKILPGGARRHTLSGDRWRAGHRTARGRRCFCRCRLASAHLHPRPGRRNRVWPARRNRLRSRLQKHQVRTQNRAGYALAPPLDSGLGVLALHEKSWDLWLFGGTLIYQKVPRKWTSSRLWTTSLVWVLAHRVWKPFSFFWLGIRACLLHRGVRLMKHPTKYRDTILYSSQQTNLRLPFTLDRRDAMSHSWRQLLSRINEQPDN